MKVGDRIEVLDEAISGVVVSVDGENIVLESADGFELSFKQSEVVKIEDEGLYVNTSEIINAVKEKKAGVKKEKSGFKKKRQSPPPLEVDLHIENLVSSTRNMDDFDILNLQLDTARSQLDFAFKKRIQKVVFIHGVGKGVLRAELETLLRRYDNLKFYDAKYSEFGHGATEVYIFQNPKN